MADLSRFPLFARSGFTKDQIWDQVYHGIRTRKMANVIREMVEKCDWTPNPDDRQTAIESLDNWRRSEREERAFREVNRRQRAFDEYGYIAEDDH